MARRPAAAVGRKAKTVNARTATWLSWAMWALTLALTACSLFLLAVNSSRPGVDVFDYWVETTLIAGASSTVGAVIVSHRPGNTIGWLFCVIGILGAIRHLNAQYANYASLVAPGLPGADVAAWISSWIWTLYVGLYALLGLLFPNGRLTSRRWRWVAWIGGSMVVTGAMLLAAMILAAIERSRSTSFSFWDALILEAALSASAD